MPSASGASKTFSDPVAPGNAYGRSKAEAESVLADSGLDLGKIEAGLEGPGEPVAAEVRGATVDAVRRGAALLEDGGDGAIDVERLAIGGIRQCGRLARPDHFAAKAEPAIHRADMYQLEQHAIGIAVDDAGNGRMRVVADRIGIFA